ncbi:protein kinase [Aggregicoccus sp. 17bor-14]|uniref:serine/threonine-protein kinase n=1 Tax=Myxococcaceae TaxID=31 RepID=UPI00129CD71C|nr:MULTISPECIES: serine/threonine-protein kinase [Myxococcaceae]MBF5042998.1 serine/threonine protein kinase [Simulacricoccus sp. 17bor-14]MRI88763.1 protein kinase [Aggregicoccus sp. 17bor-14]
MPADDIAGTVLSGGLLPEGAEGAPSGQAAARPGNVLVGSAPEGNVLAGNVLAGDALTGNALKEAGLGTTASRAPGGNGLREGELTPPSVIAADAVELPQVQVGQVLGSYQLEALLGEGSMGQVFQARHVRLDRQVALKVLRPNHTRDNAFVQRFFREAQAVNRISHEHIVEIFDFIEDRAAGCVYCVMELLRGESLAQLLERGPLSLERIQRIGVQVCAALEAAHQVGVVHRDIKPDNLFISQRPGQPDFVKVLDFGVAKLLSTPDVRGTLDGTIIGTPAYMSPEQAAGLPVDARADIYAVGTLLYEMLSGKPPFSGQSFGQLVVQVITQPPPPLPARLASGEPLPPALARLVMRCLAKEPEQRPGRLAEVSSGLLGLPPGALPTSERPTVKIPALGPVSTRTLGFAGAGAALVLLALTGVLLGSSAPASTPSAHAAPAPAPVAAAPAPQAPPVLLTVRSFPEGAEVVRTDTGEALGVTPLVRALPRTEGPLGLRIRLAGYVPLERSVVLQQDAELVLPLAKARGAAGARVPARKLAVERSSSR